MKLDPLRSTLFSFLLITGCSSRVALPDGTNEAETDETAKPEPEGCHDGWMKCGTQLGSLAIEVDWLKMLTLARGGASIAADATHLWICIRGYSPTEPRRGLFTMPKTGGPGRWLDGIECAEIVSDGTTVFWNGSLVRDEDLVPGAPEPAHVLLASDGAATPRTIAQLRYVQRFASLAEGGDRLFWIDREPPGPLRLRWAPKGGGAPSTIVEDEHATAVAADERHVFWLTTSKRDGADWAVVMRATRDGDEVQELYGFPGDRYRGIALVGDSVMFVKEDGGVWQVPKAGGLASSVGGPPRFEDWRGRIPLRSTPTSLFFADNQLEQHTDLHEITGWTPGRSGTVHTHDGGSELIPDFAVDASMIYELKLAPGGPLRVVARPR